MDRSCPAVRDARHTFADAVAGLALVGAGDVVTNKILPAILSMPSFPGQLAICSLEPEEECPIAKKAARYFQACGGRLPMKELLDAGYLSPETRWVIATPSSHHVRHASQLACFCTVAVEKPLAPSYASAQTLLRHQHAALRIHPISHKLFNRDALDLVDMCRREPAFLKTVAAVRGTFYEQDGFATGRQQEDCIADIQTHFFSILAAMFRAAGLSLRARVRQVLISRHGLDPSGTCQAPTVTTASRLTGVLLCEGREIELDLTQVKAAPYSAKRLVLEDAHREPLQVVRLADPSHVAYGRIMGELLRPSPDMRLALCDAVAVAGIIARCRERAVESSNVDYGDLPGFAHDIGPDKTPYKGKT